MDFNEEDAGKGQLKIEVQNEDNVYQWNLSKFQNRYFMIKSLLEDYYETGILPKLSQEADPFWDPPEGKFIGQAFLKMESLLYLMDCPSELALVGENLDNGWLFADLIPCDKEGIRNLS